jgi:lipoprotein-anchoring transpeptidase ErfK/SrfK
MIRMDGRLSRREFIQVAGIASGIFTLRPPPPLHKVGPVGLGRVADTWIGLYQEPTFRANRLAFLERDQLLTLFQRVVADEGPVYNPLWYEIGDGFIHSGSVQPVRWEPQTARFDIPDGGGLFEVSVPYTRTYRKPDTSSDPLYRLYYQATAWVEAVTEGADGRLWYQLLDDLLAVRYYVRAEHLRRIEPDELSPLSPEVPASEKYIEVSLSDQDLRAYERGRVIFRTSISSGVPSSKPSSNGIPTATPRGNFHIDKKMPVRHMGDGHLTANPEAYELPGVPWVAYFTNTGVAFHGTYWHCDYGRPKSHGCINMRPEEAKWIFRWATPVTEADVRLEAGYGTNVTVY